MILLSLPVISISAFLMVDLDTLPFSLVLVTTNNQVNMTLSSLFKKNKTPGKSGTCR